ncbi:hypothetical protein MNBD_GAMMA24-1963, partial [hydrothermal vent metagenome]
MILSKKNISPPVLALFLSACASPQIANIKYMDNVALKQAEETSQTPQQICETASMAIARANKEEFTFFAPLHLELASKNLKQGQDKIKNQKTVAEGMQDCFKVSKLVENGMTTKAKVESSLSDALAELKMLKSVDEEKKFTGAIQDYADDVIDLVKKIEEGDMNEAMQGQAELLKEMLTLEVNIVLTNNLEPVEAMLEKADDEDAKDLAKKTFKKAEKELESARKFIRVYYRDKQQVKNAAALAMRKAKHAYYVAQEVETLTELKPEAAEEKVLYIESLLERINRKFNKGVVIGHSLYEQTSIIGQRLDALFDVRVPANRNIAIHKGAANKNNVPVQESVAQDEPKEINPSRVIADKPQPIPVNNTETAPPVADAPEQSPVKNTEITPPVADAPEQSPVKNTETTPPVADAPEQNPVKNTETTPPVADAPEQ